MLASWSSPDTRLPEVLTRLDQLRRDANRTASRSAVVNLVVVAAVDAAAQRVVRSVTGLGAHHPGRIVVLVPDDGTAGPAGPDPAAPDPSARDLSAPDASAPELGARVELRESDVDGRHIWWEVVVLRARGAVCRHLESVMEPLLVHDLPVALWLAGGTSRVESPALVAGAHQIIVSGERAASTGRTDVAEDLAGLAARRPVADLAWLAVEPARRALAALFDPPERQSLLPPAAVTVTGPPWSARLVAAWLVERTGMDPARVTLGPDPDGAGNLRADLDLGEERAAVDAGQVWPAGSGAAPGPGVARARLGPASTVVPHGGATAANLLAMALTRPGRDARYEAALPIAGRL